MAADRPPSTAARCGTVGGVMALTGAAATWRGSRRTAFLETVCPELKACGVVAATAPGTRWLMYVTLLTITFLLTTTLL